MSILELNPTLTVMQSEELAGMLSGYAEKFPDDMPNGGADLIFDVIESLAQLDKTLSALNASFRDEGDGVMIVYAPSFTVLSVKVTVHDAEEDTDADA
jgi:hypothetical protein